MNRRTEVKDWEIAIVLNEAPITFPTRTNFSEQYTQKIGVKHARKQSRRWIIVRSITLRLRTEITWIISQFVPRILWTETCDYLFP